MEHRLINRAFIWVPILVIPLLYLKTLLDPGLLSRYIALDVFLFVFCMFSLFRAKRESITLLNNPFIYTYLIYLIICFISLNYSINKADGWFDFFRTSLGFLLIVFTVLFYSNYKGLTDDFAKSFTALNLIICAIGIVQFVFIISSSEVTHLEMHKMSGTFIHKNIYAEMLLMTLPFSIYSFIAYKGFWKYAGLTAGILSIGLIIISLTRAVWIAAFVSILITTIVLIINGEVKSIFKNRQFKIGLIIAIAAIIFSIIFFSKIERENAIQKQLSSITNFAYGSTKDRIILWEKSLKVFKEHPVIGDGLGSWKIDILKYGNKGLKSEDNITFYTRPHNDFLWVMVETGIAGLIFYILSFVFIIIFLLKILRKTFDSREKAFYYLMFSAVTGYITFSCFSFPRERIEHIIVISFIFSIILIKNRTMYEAGNMKHDLKYKSILYFIQIIALVLIIAGFKTGAKRINSEIHTRNAYIARAESDWNGVKYEIDNARSSSYTMDPVCTPLSWYRGEADFNLGNIDEAFADYQKSYEINPYHIHVLNNLATCYELKKEHAKAIEYYNKAIALSPNFEDALLNLAAVWYNLDYTDKAYEVINKIDIKTGNPKYKDFLYAILKEIIIKYNLTIDDLNIRKQLSAMTNSKDWIYDIYIKSVINKTTFKKQLLTDAIFSLEIIDKRITFAESKLLKQKYKL